jgi:hypothetical protein
MAIKAVNRAMDTARVIAESDKVPAEQKPQLTQQVLAAGAAASSQPIWDNWAQRLVSAGLGLIGLTLAVFVGIAIIQGDKIDAAVTSALTAVIGGLAGMFTQKALGGANVNPPTTPVTPTVTPATLPVAPAPPAPAPAPPAAI